MKTREFTTNWWRPEGTRGVNTQTQVWHIRAGRVITGGEGRQTGSEHTWDRHQWNQTHKKWSNWHERLDVTRKHLKHKHTWDHNTSHKTWDLKPDVTQILFDLPAHLHSFISEDGRHLCEPWRLSATVCDYYVVKQCLSLMMSDVWMVPENLCYEFTSFVSF